MEEKNKAGQELGKKSWAKRSEGKTKEEISEMMREKGKLGAKKRWENKEK